MRTVYNGVPVVTSDPEMLPRVIAGLGIVPWTRSMPLPMDLDEYRVEIMSGQNLSWDSVEHYVQTTRERQMRREEVRRFAPKTEVLFLTPPGGGETGVYFRSVGRNWVSVFATVPDPDCAPEDRERWQNLLVPIVAEWKHGAEVTVIGPVYGVLEAGESPRDCAFREFREETGFELADVEPLTEAGLAVSPRQSTQQYFPFLGMVKEPVTRGEAHLDKTEHLKLVFVSLWTWFNFLVSGAARDDNAYATTFLAMLKMNVLGAFVR
ncbi:MAG: NUDIX domain-containing protein [Candidatus Magasanikbacteria bacterium]|nr:NUDIX domain-containing protein [Candidatus Magasanikbacteria bacterium]